MAAKNHQPQQPDQFVAAHGKKVTRLRPCSRKQILPARFFKPALGHPTVEVCTHVVSVEKQVERKQSQHAGHARESEPATQAAAFENLRYQFVR